jgi:hypothetical protein
LVTGALTPGMFGFRDPDAMPLSPHPGSRGVGGLGPKMLYFWSMVVRIARSDLPSACLAITSRVMLRQMSHVAPWLLKVTWPSGRRSVI